MLRNLVLGGAALVALVLFVSDASAFGGRKKSCGSSSSCHQPVCHAPVYHAPAPVCHAPAPAPVCHAPVYHAPAPVCHAPAPVCHKTVTTCSSHKSCCGSKVRVRTSCCSKRSGCH